ncbi:MAG: sensor histidine kinase [Thiohalomonadales bacterium]
MPTDILYSEFNKDKILNNYLNSSLLLGLGFSFFYWYFSAWLNLIAPASFVLSVSLSIFLLRINYTKYASILLVMSLWLAPAWCIVFSGGLYSPLLIWLTPTIFMAGALLGSQWALFIGTLSFIFILGLFYFIETLVKLSEFHSNAGLDILFLLSAISAIILITYYGFAFTRDLKNKTIEAIASRDEAIAASNIKSQFLSSMSHELRTPMNAILGFGQLLELEANELSEDQRNNIKEILDAGNHLLHLINEILDLGRIEAGKLDIFLEKVDVDDVILQCLPLIQVQLDENKVELIDNLKGKGYSVFADFIRLKQVLLNLISNAIKYNRTFGRVILECKVINKQHLRIQVTDTGEGMHKNDIAKLFTPFERLNNVNNVEGTGIGLVISKNIIELMSGKIGVECEPGKGCTFWVELPLGIENN